MGVQEWLQKVFKDMGIVVGWGGVQVNGIGVSLQGMGTGPG